MTTTTESHRPTYSGPFEKQTHPPFPPIVGKLFTEKVCTNEH